MILIRKTSERGHFDYGWLNTYHTFSFGEYFDPHYHHFRSLRVINQDIVQPGSGFSEHGHQNMEILTYVLSGAITHQDNLGNKTTLYPGEIQRMTAGTGILHSEYNQSTVESLELLQIWILPIAKNLTPSYQQSRFIPPQNELRLIVAPNAQAENVISIHQDIKLFVGHLDKQNKLMYPLKSSRHAWLQILSGALELNQHAIQSGDGAAVSNEENLTITAELESTFLLFDLN